MTGFARLGKLQDITAIIGYDPEDHIYHCKLQYVDPQITVEFKETEIKRLAPERLNSLLQNLRALTHFEQPLIDH